MSSNFHPFQAIRALGVAAMLLTAGLTAASPADAATEGQCGYLGRGEYQHCDGGSGVTVDLDVEDFWGNHYRYCVGPGKTNLQAVIRWMITGAWWNGGVRCIPGFEGPV